jgi:hypothetical protein
LLAIYAYVLLPHLLRFILSVSSRRWHIIIYALMQLLFRRGLRAVWLASQFISMASSPSATAASSQVVTLMRFLEILFWSAC